MDHGPNPIPLFNNLQAKIVLLLFFISQGCLKIRMCDRDHVHLSKSKMFANWLLQKKFANHSSRQFLFYSASVNSLTRGPLTINKSGEIIEESQNLWKLPTLGCVPICCLFLALLKEWVLVISCMAMIAKTQVKI